MSPALLEAAKAALEKIHAIHKAFGAPGEYGYSTMHGKALYGLYCAGDDLQSAINRSDNDADDVPYALKVAEDFMSGFEGDEMQDGIDAKLALIRAAIAKQSN